MDDIAPLGYERYAVLVSPLLVPNAVTAKLPPVSSGPIPLNKTASSSFQKHSDQNLGKPSISTNIVDEHKPQFRLKSIPFKHPDPATERGQNIDFLV